MNWDCINLGCGHTANQDDWNVDCRPLPGVDCVWDLDDTPWPFGVGWNRVRAWHVMEHLSQPVAFLREAVRILRPGGVADIRVPHAQGWLAHAPGHQTLFSLQWFDCISSGDDMQESAIVEGCTVRVFLRLHHYRIRGKLLSLPVRLLSRAWEGYFNRTHNRQVWWEQLGVLPPSEIHVLITKRERPR